MEILLYVYFGINLMMLGSYLFDGFNNDSKITKIFSSVVLFFFGGILVVYELTIADKVAEWWYNSEIGFWYRLNISKEYDDKSSDYLEALKRRISAEKENKDKESQKLVKHLTRIVERNNQKDTVK